MYVCMMYVVITKHCILRDLKTEIFVYDPGGLNEVKILTDMILCDVSLLGLQMPCSVF